MSNRFLLCGALAFGLGASGFAGVVINEIFYHAPDDFDDLEWVELHNPDKEAVDVSGWKLKQAVAYTFPANSTIGPGEFVVLCKNKKLFADFYDVPVKGEFSKSISNSGETIELVDGNGKRVDSVTFTDRAPWPEAADGHSSSMERISPSVAGERAENWDASTLPADVPVAAGTPGKVNSAFSAIFPPVIRDVAVTPTNPKAGESMTVEATVEGGGELKAVEVRYQIAKPGAVGAEKTIAMKSSGNGKYKAEIPAATSGDLIRLRVRAEDQQKAMRFYPSLNSLRPAVSVFVQDKPEAAQIPLAWIIHTDVQEYAAMERLRKGTMQDGGNRFGSQEHWQLQELLARRLSLPEMWTYLTIEQPADYDTAKKLRAIFLTKNKEKEELIEKLRSDGNLSAAIEKAPEVLGKFEKEFVETVRKGLPPEQGAKLED
ncbi:MAG TPA: lamin tail domain-containing protein, partial [Candidatus Kapabacteria bacterium]|nr:lamin tail domain-containing protein [Candidatus Kapabacteria bacterium]